MELLAPLPGRETNNLDAAWTAAELALFSPAVLKHMADSLGLNVNARLTGDIIIWRAARCCTGCFTN